LSVTFPLMVIDLTGKLVVLSPFVLSSVVAPKTFKVKAAINSTRILFMGICFTFVSEAKVVWWYFLTIISI